MIVITTLIDSPPAVSPGDSKSTSHLSRGLQHLASYR
jgi:hypothetical protein